MIEEASHDGIENDLDYHSAQLLDIWSVPAEEKSEKADDASSCWSSLWPGQSHSHPSFSLMVYFLTLAYLLGVWMTVVLVFGD